MPGSPHRRSPKILIRLASLILAGLLLAGCQPIEDVASEEPVTHLGAGPWDEVFEPYVAWQEENREAGFDFEMYLSAMIQRGSNHTRPNRLFNGSVDVFAELEVCEDPFWGQGGAGLHFWHIQDFTGQTAYDLAVAQGTTILPNDEAGEPDTALGGLWWQQEGMFDGALDLQLGALCPNDIFDDNTYANWDRTSFLAQPLASNPTRIWPSTGLGVLARVHPAEFCEITAAVLDGKGTDHGPDFGSLGDRRMARLAEIAFKPEISGLGAGAWRCTWQSMDSSEAGPASEGILVSVEQEVGRDAALFLRYGNNDGARTDVDQVLAGGVVFTAPFGYNQDWLGLGAVRTWPTDRSLPQDVALEAFWRMQLTRHIQVTPDIQVHLRTSDPDQDPLVTGGLRINLTL